MKKLLVGGTGEYLSIAAKKISQDAILLDNINYEKISTTDGVYFTSLGDIIQVDNFCQTLMHADEIIFLPPPEEWSGRDIIDSLPDKRFTMETETKEHLYQWMWIKQQPVKNLSLPEFKNSWQIIHRVDSTPQLWNIGCSITAGNGVELHERYGEIISNELNMPISILAYEGSSSIWASDQILTADVRAGDTVIWGLTSMNRYSYRLHSDRFYHVNHSFFKNYPLSRHIVPLSWLESPNNFYHTINAVSKVQNFCKKVKANLVLLGFLDVEYYSKHYDIVDLSAHCWIDQGTDKLHPGPKSHKLFADRTLEQLDKIFDKS